MSNAVKLLRNAVEVDLATEHVMLGNLTYARDFNRLQISLPKTAFDNGDWSFGDVIELQIYDDTEEDYVTRFKGRLMEPNRRATGISENLQLEAHGLGKTLKDIGIYDSSNSTVRIVYNASGFDEDCDTSRAGLTIQEILEDVWDLHSTELTDRGITDFQYDSTLADVPLRMDFSGEDLFTVLQTVLSERPDVIFYTDDTTGKVHFISLDDLTQKTFTLGTDRVEAVGIMPMFDGRFSRVEIEGKSSTKTQTWLYDVETPGNSTMAEGWNVDLEATWTPTLAQTDGLYNSVYRAFYLSSVTRISGGMPVEAMILIDSESETWKPIRAKMERGQERDYLMLEEPALDNAGALASVRVRGTARDTDTRVRVSAPRSGSDDFTADVYDGEIYDQFGVEKTYRLYEEEIIKEVIDNGYVSDISGPVSDKYQMYWGYWNFTYNCFKGNTIIFTHGETTVETTIDSNHRNQFTINDATGMDAIEIGDSFQIVRQDDTDYAKKLADGFLKLLSRPKWQGDVTINRTQDFSTTLGHGLSLAGHSITALANVKVPISEITYDLRTEGTVIQFADNVLGDDAHILIRKALRKKRNLLHGSYVGQEEKDEGIELPYGEAVKLDESIANGESGNGKWCSRDGTVIGPTIQVTNTGPDASADDVVPVSRDKTGSFFF